MSFLNLKNNFLILRISIHAVSRSALWTVELESKAYVPVLYCYLFILITYFKYNFSWDFQPQYFPPLWFYLFIYF